MTDQTMTKDEAIAVILAVFVADEWPFVFFPGKELPDTLAEAMTVLTGTQWHSFKAENKSILEHTPNAHGIAPIQQVIWHKVRS